MPTVMGSFRRLVFTPSLEEVTFERRGFGVPASAVTQRLEAIPQSVIVGFEWGIDTRDQWELERRLSLVEQEQQGFAYEGATMAFTLLDVMRPGRGHKARDLLMGPARPHIFLTYIGIGFAMARLPRSAWRKVVPDLQGSPYFPALTWLAVDGYGFDRAYFDTRRWVDEQYVPTPYPWEGAPDYFLRAVDQGIGRALWFIHGADPRRAVAAVRRFAPHRQADLWSGLGLAGAFAGGTDADGFALLREEAGEYRAEVAQGAVFAAKARHYAGCVPAHTATATETLAGMSVEAASALAESAAAQAAPTAGEPAYEVWRRHVRTRVAAGESSASIHGAE